MSYLGFPRLTFSGKFQADPSTVNNDPYHFNDATFVPNDQEPETSTQMNGWWNPSGTAYWRFKDVTVKSAVYKDGSVSYDHQDDPVVGMSIGGSEKYVDGKLVDLDPEQQMVSEIWGLQIVLGRSGEDNSFSSDFLNTPFCDIFVRYPEGKPDSFFSAVYQSLLENIDWSDVINSRFLKELEEDGKMPEKLSIKFVVDGFDDTVGSPDFTWGRVVGLIGPYEEGEPKRFVNARYLRPETTGNTAMNYAPAVVDKENLMLHLDLSNSLPTSSVGGPLANNGMIEVGVMKGNDFVFLGRPLYTEESYYLVNAAVSSFKLTREHLKLVESSPIIVRQFNEQSATWSTTLSENSEGAFMRADEFVLRIEGGESATSTIYANQWGVPAANVQVNLTYNDSLLVGQVKQGSKAGPPVAEPKSALSFPDGVTTDSDGKAVITFATEDPCNPRGYIDGQVYGVEYAWNGLDDYQPNPTNLYSILVFDDYKYNSPPNWLANVRPIMQQYANLYPVMRDILDLSSYHSLVQYKAALQMVFSKDITDPNYMPVTRDLSAPKKKMLQEWLAEDDPLYMDIQTLDDLKQALQLAIELEHSTLPPYLTAYFSIIPGHNHEVAQIIRSVLMEEMLHMSLACNMLNAIGGNPAIDVPGFIPVYPTELPGSLRPGLTVTLKKASIDQIRDVFMGIEEPGVTIEPKAKHSMTIGWFYKQIAQGFEHLVKKLGKENVFVGDATRQLTEWEFGGTMIPVYNLKDALAAIKEIVEEGEGASPFNPMDGDHELAHYYKFAEIVEGRRLVVHKKKKKYSYTGEVIPFDPAGVYPMQDNPGMNPLSKDSPAYLLEYEFNKTYTRMLRSLHYAFNGHIDKILDGVSLMFSLTVQARKLMQTPIEKGGTVTAAPSFRYTTGG